MAERDGWALLLGVLRPHRRALVRVLCWSALEALPVLLGGRLLAAALDHGFLTGRPWVGLGLLACWGAAVVAGAVATRAMFPALASVTEGVRDALVTRVVRDTLARAVQGAAVDHAAVSRMTEQAQNVRNVLAALLRSLRPTVVTLVAALAGLATLAPAVLLVAAPPVLVAALLFALWVRPLARSQRRLVMAGERVAGGAARLIGGVRDIVAYGAEERAAAGMSRDTAEAEAASRSLARANTARTLIFLTGGHLPVILVLLAAPSLVAAGQVTAGEVVGAVAYVTTGLTPALRSVVGVVGGWGVQLSVMLGRVAAGATAVPVPAARPVPRDLTIRASGLTFAYGQGILPVVAGLDLTVPPGEHLAIVGPSGIGKSTLAGLFTGLIRPLAGSVTVGGAPPAPPAVALIPQEAYVFSGTLRENLAYLRPGASDADFDHAVALFGLAAVSARLGGLDAPLTDPGALSLGERQLIALARVYLSPSPIVILDEATCHLDPAMEELAEHAFARRGGTLIIIAHRMTSALRAGRVLVLDEHGAETGTHEELLRSSPLYAELFGHWQFAT